MPIRNISDIDLLPVYHALIDETGTHPTDSVDTKDRHDFGLNIYAGIVDAEDYADGTYNIQVEHSDEPTTGFVPVPEADILTPTTTYPTLSNLEMLGFMTIGFCYKFAQLKAYKRYVRAAIIAIADSGATVTVQFGFRPNNQATKSGQHINVYAAP